MSNGKARDAAKDFNTLQAAGNTKPTGIWSDGATMWVADDTDSKLYAYKMSDGSRDAGKDFNTLQAARQHQTNRPVVGRRHPVGGGL